MPPARSCLGWPLLLLGCAPSKSGVETGCGEASTWYADADGDGYGDRAAAIEQGCAPAGYVENADDCDDGAVAVHPGANEIWYDGADEDCSGGSDFDQDGDGYVRDEECDDLDPDAYPDPSAKEVWYDGVDDNCDGNDGDQDGDGWYVSDYPYEVPGPYQGRQGDCVDDPGDNPTPLNGFPALAAVDIHPGADDAPYDGIDQDCDNTDEFDADGDGYATSAWPDGTGAYGDDCDDSRSEAFPGAAELCNGQLEDCRAGTWSPNAEARRASVESTDGAWTDVTAELTGAPGAPVVWTPPGEGTVWFCSGTWYARLVLPVDGVALALRGRDGAENVILDAQSTGSVVTAPSGAVSTTISELTLQGGAAERGGGLVALGAALTLEDAVVRANTAESDGGGLYATHGPLVVRRSSVEDNRAAEAGAGIYVGEADLELEDVSVTGNVTQGDPAYGGGLAYGDNTGYTLTLTRVRFEENAVYAGTEEAEGGGAYIWSAGTLTATDVTWNANTTSSSGLATGGGARLVLLGAGAATVIGGVWTANTATGGEEAYGGGARIYHEGVGDLTLQDALFDGNQAASDALPAGGGMLYGGYATGRLVVTNSVVSDNHCVTSRGVAAGLGGGLYLEPYGTALAFGGVEIRDNTAVNGEGVELVAAQGGSAAFVDTTIADNGGFGLLYLAQDDDTELTLEDSSVTGHTSYGVFVYALTGGHAWLTCSGDKGAAAGIYANPGYGLTAWCTYSGGSCTLTAATCDLGEASAGDDNTAGDLFLDNTLGAAVGNDASFVCEDAVCG